MTDYTKATGASGTMLIRVTSTTVEFWLKAGSATYNHQLPWRYTANGSTTATKYFDFKSGGSYQKLGSVTVSTDQTVTFYLFDSGTSGIGGPTSFSVSVDRTSAPPTPPAWKIEVIEDTQVRGDIDGFGNGGLAIDQIQVRYDDNTGPTSPSYASDDANMDGYFWIYGLARSKTYYFWVRTHNAKGWSPWSARSQATTHNFPAAPGTPVLSNITQSSMQSRFAVGNTGGSAILENQTGYGTDPTTPQLFISSYQPFIDNLQPGKTYYVWGRSRNVYGWGPWGPRASSKLLAGAWVDVDGVKKRAVPYVKVNGVWKVAESWAKIAGLWKVTG